MNVDTAKRVMAIQRQIAGITAMMNSGKLTTDEARVLVEPLQAELGAIRSQATLPLKTDPALKSGKVGA